MKKIIIYLLLCSFAVIQADEEVHKVVYDLTTSKLVKFEKTVLKAIAINKTHYENKFQELEVAVVIHGGAYKFFTKDIGSTIYKDDLKLVKEHESLKKRIQTMSDTYDVEFLMCEVGMLRNKLDANNIMDFVKIVPNSTIGLINKQNEGFAYLPVRD